MTNAIEHTLRREILVVGAGELGWSVLQALATERARGHWNLAVLLRPGRGREGDPLRQALASLGVRVVEADIAAASVGELATVFSQFHTVVNCMGFVAGQGSQLKLGHAVLQAGVACYVPWQFGVNYDQVAPGTGGGIFDEQIAVRRMLRAQARTSWLIVSTGMFTSFLFEPSFGVVDLQRSRVHALGAWETTVTVTPPADIGRLTTELLIRVPAGGGQVYYVAGDTVSYGRLADVVEAHFGRRFARAEWSIDHLRQELQRQPDDGMRKYRLAFAQEPGVAWPKDATFNARNGLKTQDLAEWVAANLPR